MSRSVDAKSVGLLYGVDLVSLASSDLGLQHALNGFAVAWDFAGIKITSSKTEVIHTFFEKFCLLFSASWWSIIEAGKKVQVSWGRSHE